MINWDQSIVRQLDDSKKRESPKTERKVLICPRCHIQLERPWEPCVKCGRTYKEIIQQQMESIWQCKCGVKNVGKYCENCGAKRQEQKRTYVCDKCGWKSEEYAGRFCPNCSDQSTKDDIKFK